MSFGNGPAKGNGRGPVRGKSILDHMADAIADGLSQPECVVYVLQRVSVKRISQRRLREIHADMLPNAGVERLPTREGGSK